MENLRFVSSAISEILGVPTLENRSRDLGHAYFCPMFYFFGLVSLKVNLRAKFEVCIFSRSSEFWDERVLLVRPILVMITLYTVSQEKTWYREIVYLFYRLFISVSKSKRIFKIS